MKTFTSEEIEEFEENKPKLISLGFNSSITIEDYYTIKSSMLNFVVQSAIPESHEDQIKELLSALGDMIRLVHLWKNGNGRAFRIMDNERHEKAISVAQKYSKPINPKQILRPS